MALTDADRMQMALMALMRHNIFNTGGSVVVIDYYGLGNVPVINPTGNAVVTATKTLAQYLLT